MLEQRTTTSQQIHVALVKIRQLQSLDEATLAGIAQTLSHLGQLGLVSIVVLDCAENSSGLGGENLKTLRELYMKQADRLVSAIDHDNAFKARRLDHIIGVTKTTAKSSPDTPEYGNVSVEFDDVLLRTLSADIIPVIAPVAYTTDSQTVTEVDADEVLLALSRQFFRLPAGSSKQTSSQTQPFDSSLEQTESLVQIVAVERIIILDPLGGLPSGSRPDKAHIFINLKQEYNEIKEELEAAIETAREDLLHPAPQRALLGGRTPLSRLAEQKVLRTGPAGNPIHDNNPQLDALQRHLSNIDLLDKTLSFLPPTSSALITTPQEAAISLPANQAVATTIGVGTRQPRNSLIYSLLTDKPLISSSLPVSRVRLNAGNGQIEAGRATFVKRGMSVTMFPDPRYEAWEPPTANNPGISLDDPRIDFSRLLALIEDSFNRPLDVNHFLARIRHRIAGIIVAGEYEGGALLTWELPPGVPDDGSEESRQRMVPYLDKFAVLKRSQGSGGVADIMFSAMVRSCLPDGVCWRSRKTNPVNKWYFERSLGTFKLPDSTWSMFWTTPALLEDKQRFLDYEAVCRAVQPSWADRNKVK